VNLLDLIIILAAVGYAIGGFRSGAIVGVFSLVGFFGGAAIGAQLANPIGSALANGRAQVPIAIVCVLLFAMLGQLLGVVVAGHVKARLVGEWARPWDAGIGAVLGVVSVLLVSWMVAVPLASSPYPGLAAEATHSTIVRGVNDVVPAPVRGLYSSLRRFLDQSGFPPVLGDFPSESIVPVPPPPANLSKAVKRRIARVQPSVVKVLGQAPQCSRAIEGTGFVYAPNRVLTNAHVVAGTQQVQIELGTHETTAATVVLFDPRRDVAVLDVPGLDAPALPFAAKPAKTGDPALVLGYPENGPFTVRSARVRSETTAGGSDIYGNGGLSRSIYAIRAIVRSGNSGGPLLAPNGRVLGMVFATARDSADTGFALSDDEIRGDAKQGRNASATVPTAGCTPD
jgi:S1-C subfamily serine protease